METIAQEIDRRWPPHQRRAGLVIAALLFAAAVPLTAQEPIVIRVGTLMDGKGGVQRNATVVVEAGSAHPWIATCGRLSPEGCCRDRAC